MRFSKIKVAALLTGLVLVSSLAGCKGNQEASTQYVSPSFDNQTTEIPTMTDASTTDASLTDAIAEAASANDAASAGDADQLPASLSDALPMGTYSDDHRTYYNPLGNFKLSMAEDWQLMDADSVASTTDASVDEISNLWSGLKQPKDFETSFCAIANRQSTGSNIIISYLSPSAYLMPDLTAEKYLGMSVSRYENASVGTVKFLGQDYYFLDIPKNDSSVGRRVQLASDHDGLILIVTMTLQEDEELTDAFKLFDKIW